MKDWVINYILDLNSVYSASPKYLLKYSEVVTLEVGCVWISMTFFKITSKLEIKILYVWLKIVGYTGKNYYTG